MSIARVIALLREQKRNPRGEIDLARIDVQHPLEGLERLLAFPILLQVECLDVIEQRPHLALALGFQGEVLGRMQNERVIQPRYSSQPAMGSAMRNVASARGPARNETRRRKAPAGNAKRNPLGIVRRFIRGT